MKNLRQDGASGAKGILIKARFVDRASISLLMGCKHCWPVSHQKVPYRVHRSVHELCCLGNNSRKSPGKCAVTCRREGGEEIEWDVGHRHL